jgi:hypothetical protein
VDGTAVADSDILPKGTPVKYQLYVNNRSSTRTDVSVRDVLDDPTFAYQIETLRVDNTVGECATSPCSPAEEASIFAAVDDAQTDPA